MGISGRIVMIDDNGRQAVTAFGSSDKITINHDLFVADGQIVAITSNVVSDENRFYGSMIHGYVWRMPRGYESHSLN